MKAMKCIRTNKILYRAQRSLTLSGPVFPRQIYPVTYGNVLQNFGKNIARMKDSLGKSVSGYVKSYLKLKIRLYLALRQRRTLSSAIFYYWYKVLSVREVGYGSTEGPEG